MTEEAEIKPCSNPGCDQPGTKSCSACKTSVYCCVNCQTADWPKHKEECDGHLRKVDIAHIVKAQGFERDRNWPQTFRHGEIAATKLKKLKDRRLETVEIINDAMKCKFNSLNFMDRNKEAKECAEENYTNWAMNHMRHPGSIKAALALIESCIHNKEYEDAEHYARHAMFMIKDMADNFIPSEQHQNFLAEGSYYLASAISKLAQAGGIPPEDRQKAGEEAISLARQALELRTRLDGTEGSQPANCMGALADALDYFNDVDDDEVLRLREQSIAIYRRVQGRSSYNVAASENKLANAYERRAFRAYTANDLGRSMTNLELALPEFADAARIYRAINHEDRADEVLHKIAKVEKNIRVVREATAVSASRG